MFQIVIFAFCSISDTFIIITLIDAITVHRSTHYTSLVISLFITSILCRYLSLTSSTRAKISIRVNVSRDLDVWSASSVKILLVFQPKLASIDIRYSYAYSHNHSSLAIMKVFSLVRLILKYFVAKARSAAKSNILLLVIMKIWRSILSSPLSQIEK